jgi:uncharacterized membrane protein
MSDTQFDVVIAAYLIPDLAQKDFDTLVGLVKDKQLTVEGVALVTNDADGNVTVKETGDHLGRKGLEIGGGVGLVVGLFAPPLLASVAVGGAAGALVGKFARHRVESGLAEKMGAVLPPGSAGIVAIYDRTKTSTVDAALASAVRKIGRTGRRRRRQEAQGHTRRSTSRHERLTKMEHRSGDILPPRDQHRHQRADHRFNPDEHPVPALSDVTILVPAVTILPLWSAVIEAAGR